MPPISTTTSDGSAATSGARSVVATHASATAHARYRITTRHHRMQSTMTLGVAIFGAGRAGHGHARAISQTAGAELVAVFDADQARANSFAEAHGCQAFTRSDDVLKREDVQLVMVALPNFLHEQATVDSASAGKHIFLEKPMADTLEECDRMLLAVQRAGV